MESEESRGNRRTCQGFTSTCWVATRVKRYQPPPRTSSTDFSEESE
jgi:hypothetical protein